MFLRQTVSFVFCLDIYGVGIRKHSRYPRYPFTYHIQENSGPTWSFMAVVLNLHFPFDQVGVMAGIGYIMHVTRVIDLQNILKNIEHNKLYSIRLEYMTETVRLTPAICIIANHKH